MDPQPSILPSSTPPSSTSLSSTVTSKPIKLTAYRLLCSASFLAFGIPKAVAASQNEGSVANIFDWVGGIVCALILFWLGLAESREPKIWEWFFHRDYQPEILFMLKLCYRGLRILVHFLGVFLPVLSGLAFILPVILEHNVFVNWAAEAAHYQVYVVLACIGIGPVILLASLQSALVRYVERWPDNKKYTSWWRQTMLSDNPEVEEWLFQRGSTESLSVFCYRVLRIPAYFVGGFLLSSPGVLFALYVIWEHIARGNWAAEAPRYQVVAVGICITLASVAIVGGLQRVLVLRVERWVGNGKYTAWWWRTTTYGRRDKAKDV